ncbi:MAG: glycosyltransferase [Acidobacteria bacterium]|nr:glycosyltransferase [Acidobacteriota bacterium]MCI0628407.1 glycosyltransferase [Acidobacteriota bacterium]MCI0719292.1 glycosyltransferase [Acidobacteriota bacterium]
MTENSIDSSPTGAILLLTSCYPKWPGEPSGIFLHHLAKELIASGWRVLVLAPNFPGGRKREELEGVSVCRFNYFIPRLQRLCYGSGILPNLRKSPWLWGQVPFLLAAMFCCAVWLVRREKIWAMNAHWILPQGLVAAFLRVFCRSPLVLSVHGGDLFAFRGAASLLLKRLVLKQADCCTANSRYTRQVLQELGCEAPVSLVPMGVDLEDFRPDRFDAKLRTRLAIRGQMILFVGRLVEKKGARHLLEAMPEVLRRFPQAVLVVVGDGALRESLQLLARSMAIMDSVRFMGTISHSELPQFYATTDLFVGPSVVDADGDTEGLGVVFLEAAASEVPIIGTTAGGIPDILIHEVTGLMVPPGDSHRLAQAMTRLLQDADLRRRLAFQARAHVVKRFSWENVAVEFGRVFESTRCQSERLE